MRVCLRCAAEIRAENWHCEACGHAPALIDGFPAFAPQLAEWRMLISPLILIIIMLTRQTGLLGSREWSWLRPKQGA